MIIAVTKSPAPVQPGIPEKGYYARLNWMYGDADGYQTTTAGPIPEERTDLYLEFLNVLEDMVKLYADTGKGGYDDYDDVKNYKRWFDEDYEEPGDWINNEPSPDKAVRDYAGAEQVWEPYDGGGAAELTGFEPYYCDGTSAMKYPVTLTRWDKTS